MDYDLLKRSSIDSNTVQYPIDITVRGTDWLWAAFAVMLSSGLVITILAHAQPVGRRGFHFIGVALLFTASVAYFTMASNLGKVGILAEFPRSGKANLYSGPAANAYRSIWYARYIDWTITTPLLLLELLLTTGLPLSYIFFTIFMDLVMIETGLIGALVASQYKWGFFAFGCVAQIYIFWVLIGPARSSAKALGDDVHSVYLKSVLVLSVLWLLYPVCWGLADGGNYISSDSEMVFYGVLDVLAKPVFLAFHLFSMRKIDYSRYELQSGHYSIGAIDNFGHNEKQHVNGVANGHSNTVSNSIASGNGTVGRQQAPIANGNVANGANRA